MKDTSTRIAVPVALVLAVSAVPVFAGEEMPFADAQVLLQLDDTDGDLGFHARIDGEPWKRVTI